MHSYKKRNYIKNAINLGLLFAGAILIIFFVTHFLDARTIDKKQTSLDVEREMNSYEYNGESFALKENVESFLLIGLDTFGEQRSNDSYYNNEQADFLILAVLDHNENTCSFLQLNRDTMCDVIRLGVSGEKYGTSFEQLALAHTYGDGYKTSCDNTVETVENLLGIRINKYISLSMDAVSILNDYIGGVVVEDDMYLAGEEALKYVRARIGVDDSTNISRMHRQNEYLHGFIRQLKLQNPNFEFMQKAYEQVEPYILTNVTTDVLYNFTDNISKYKFGDVITPAGEVNYDSEYAEFYIDKDDLSKKVIDLFCVK